MRVGESLGFWGVHTLGWVLLLLRSLDILRVFRCLECPGGLGGSCTGSQVILELLLNGASPAAIVLCQPDEIIALGAIVAEELFDRKLPVLCLEARADLCDSWKHFWFLVY